MPTVTFYLQQSSFSPNTYTYTYATTAYGDCSVSDVTPRSFSASGATMPGSVQADVTSSTPGSECELLFVAGDGPGVIYAANAPNASSSSSSSSSSSAQPSSSSSTSSNSPSISSQSSSSALSSVSNSSSSLGSSVSSSSSSNSSSSSSRSSSSSSSDCPCSNLSQGQIKGYVCLNNDIGPGGNPIWQIYYNGHIVGSASPDIISNGWTVGAITAKSASVSVPMSANVGNYSLLVYNNTYVYDGCFTVSAASSSSSLSSDSDSSSSSSSSSSSLLGNSSSSFSSGSSSSQSSGSSDSSSSSSGFTSSSSSAITPQPTGCSPTS